LGALPARHVARSQLPSLALVMPQAGFLPWLSSTAGLPSWYSTTARAAVASSQLGQP
jgi:hypothetical protein